MRYYKKTFFAVILMFVWLGIFLFGSWFEWDSLLLFVIAILGISIFASFIPLCFIVEQDDKSMREETERKMNEAIERAFLKIEEKKKADIIKEKKKPHLYLVK